MSVCDIAKAIHCHDCRNIGGSNIKPSKENVWVHDQPGFQCSVPPENTREDMLWRRHANGRPFSLGSCWACMEWKTPSEPEMGKDGKPKWKTVPSLTSARMAKILAQKRRNNGKLPQESIFGLSFGHFCPYQAGGCFPFGFPHFSPFLALRPFSFPHSPDMIPSLSPATNLRLFPICTSGRGTEQAKTGQVNPDSLCGHFRGRLLPWTHSWVHDIGAFVQSARRTAKKAAKSALCSRGCSRGRSRGCTCGLSRGQISLSPLVTGFAAAILHRITFAAQVSLRCRQSP